MLRQQAFKQGGFAALAAATSLLIGCSANGSTAIAPVAGGTAARASSSGGGGSLGYIISGGTSQHLIAGIGIDVNGSEGVFSTGWGAQTFDQATGKIIATFPAKVPKRTSYEIEGGVTTGGVALLARYVVPKGTIYAKRFYDLVNPLTANKFTGAWTSPIKDFQVEQTGPNQTSALTAMYGIELKNQDAPDLIVSNIAKNTVSKVFKLSSEFTLGTQPQLAQDTATNQAIFALSPDGGAAGGVAPVNVLIDMKTGKMSQFNGYNNGYEHAGDVNGLAVDPATGIAATDTQLNAEFELYDLKKKAGITAVQLPCTGTGSELSSGNGIANDSQHGLFLVAVQYYGCARGSAIIVYDEKGTVVETITGFNFEIGEPAPALNPGKRMGWAVGPQENEIQEFTY